MARSDHTHNFARFILLASICLVVAALYFAHEILVPIALAILISFLLAPMVHRLERMKLPRVAAVLVTVVFAFGLLGAVGYVVYNQLYDLSYHLDEYRTNIQTKIDSFRNGKGFFADIERAGREMSTMMVQPSTRPGVAGPKDASAHAGAPAPAPPSTQNAVPVMVTNSALQSPNPNGQSPLALVENVGGRILGPFGTAILIIILTVFMLLQREDLRDRFIRLIGRSQLTVTTQALDDAADRVSRYLLAQSILNGSEGVAVMIALWAIGHLNGRPFPSPALWGLLTALLRFVPYIGIWMSTVMPIVLALASYSSARVALETAGAYVAIEVTLANAIEPFVLGSSTGMAPLAVLVSATFWTWLWGPLGLLLSTPLTVCLVVLGKYVPQLEFLSILLGDEPALHPPARVYQRLLALDQEEADDLVREYETRMPLEQLYDEVLLPALAMTEWDWHRDQLDSERHDFIRHGFRDLIEQSAERERARILAAAAQGTVQEARGEPATAPPAGSLTAPTPAAPLAPQAGRFQLPRNCVVKVAALPAHKQDDEIAALMFAHLLELRGYCVTRLSVNQLASEVLDVIEREKFDAVCISALAPAATVYARYLCKRLHERFPKLPGVIGLWRSRTDLEKARARIGCADGVQVVSSLRDALAVMHQLVQPRLVSLGASTAVGDAASPPPAVPPVR
jgi:predicted PurR-regulated permease PerM